MATKPKPKQNDSEVLSLRLDRAVLQALARAAKKEERTVSNLARMIIRAGLAERGEATK